MAPPSLRLRTRDLRKSLLEVDQSFGVRNSSVVVYPLYNIETKVLIMPTLRPRRRGCATPTPEPTLFFCFFFSFLKQKTQQRRRRRGGILELLLHTCSYDDYDSVLPHIRWIRTVIERATRSHQTKREREFIVLTNKQKMCEFFCYVHSESWRSC